MTDQEIVLRAVTELRKIAAEILLNLTLAAPK
jgi:hypothetical protein